jgi:hypothetical protein
LGIIDYRKDGGLHLVTMNSGQNTICPDWQQRMLEILDSVEGDCGQCAALVLTDVQSGEVFWLLLIIYQQQRIAVEISGNRPAATICLI